MNDLFRRGDFAGVGERRLSRMSPIGHFRKQRPFAMSARLPSGLHSLLFAQSIGHTSEARHLATRGGRNLIEI